MTTETCGVCGGPIGGGSIVITAVDDEGVARVHACSVRCANVVTNPQEQNT